MADTRPARASPRPSAAIAPAAVVEPIPAALTAMVPSERDAPVSVDEPRRRYIVYQASERQALAGAAQRLRERIKAAVGAIRSEFRVGKLQGQRGVAVGCAFYAGLIFGVDRTLCVHLFVQVCDFRLKRGHLVSRKRDLPRGRGTAFPQCVELLASPLQVVGGCGGRFFEQGQGVCGLLRRRLRRFQRCVRLVHASAESVYLFVGILRPACQIKQFLAARARLLHGGGDRRGGTAQVGFPRKHMRC